MTIVSSGLCRYNASTMPSSRRTLQRFAGVMLAALLATGMGRAPTTAGTPAAGSTVPVRLIVCVQNIDYHTHPIRIAIDGQPVFRRTVCGPSNANWPFFGGRCQTQTVRLTAGAHQLALEEDVTHVSQQAQIAVTRSCQVRVGFWPWYQDGRFRQEPHFTVTMYPPAAGSAS